MASDKSPVIVDGATTVDAPEDIGASDSPTDAQFLTLSDGRILQIVDHCPPRPLRPQDGGSTNYLCPDTLDQGIAYQQAFAKVFLLWKVGRCSEGYWLFDGGGDRCFYQADSRYLFAAEVGGRMVVCQGAELASLKDVYGESVQCTGIQYVTVGADGGG